MATVQSKLRPAVSFLSRLVSLKPFSTSRPPRFTNTPSSFDFSDSEPESNHPKPDLPSPSDPFSIQSHSDPTNLQEIFHGMRTEGLTNQAIKMFDGLSRDGLTHEALELFSVIKDRGKMPDVVAHTAVIAAYVSAGGAHWKDAIRVYEKMLASGVLPNAYTYMVLIKGLAKERRLTEARKYLVEMVTRGMRPNCGTYMSVFEAYVAEEKLLEGKELFEELKKKGFTLDEKTVRGNTVKRGHVFKSLMSMLFDK
ncbi:hypothetical protein LUZ60_009504 [Juncus effusus]|nr:hypothetical protein LUZ60_009504 [Juncus effusus]